MLGAPQLSMLMMGAFLAIISLAVLLHYFSLRYAIVNDSPYLRSLLVSLQAQENERMQTYLRDSLNTMASKVGELQARLLRVDALGERLTKVARLKPQDFMFDRVPGRGGAESSLPSTELSMKDLGINSLDIVEVVSASMRELKVKVPRSELSKLTDVNGLVDLLYKAASEKERASVS